jgi:hypothetical protein
MYGLLLNGYSGEERSKVEPQVLSVLNRVGDNRLSVGDCLEVLLVSGYTFDAIRRLSISGFISTVEELTEVKIWREDIAESATGSQQSSED